MLNAETAVAWAVFLFEALVEVEDFIVGAVADGVGDELQASLIGGFEPGVEAGFILKLIAGEAAIGRGSGGGVEVGVEEPGG